MDLILSAQMLNEAVYLFLKYSRIEPVDIMVSVNSDAVLDDVYDW